MAESDNTYVAWDGVLYEGSPPAGWYLATDNRWWPPQEVIEGGSFELDDPYAADQADPYAADLNDPYAADQAAPYATDLNDPFGGTPDRGVSSPESPPDSWAPKSGGQLPPPRAELPPRPTSGRAGPQGPPQTQRRGQPVRPNRRRPGGFKPGFLIPFLIFGLFRCGEQINLDSSPADFPDFSEPTIEFGEEFDFQDEPFEGPTAVRVRDDFIEVDSNVPFYIEFHGCGPETIPMYLVNEGAPGAFTVDLTFQPLGSADGDPVAEPFDLSWNGGLETNEIAEPDLAIPDDRRPIADCLLVDAEVNRS